ncbi:hypothetical protein BpHYR1_045713 [Brachionus plicatilis]|uniref:Uncharacterized protein n=1 Tax=Brachionus plicatilis TaxID=10195 RepID=A0A3M7PYR3_BRAPC|nr:hypothetical protein BpHYR1_045713 [Brachionus plicatilis]
MYNKLHFALLLSFLTNEILIIEIRKKIITLVLFANSLNQGMAMFKIWCKYLVPFKRFLSISFEPNEDIEIIYVESSLIRKKKNQKMSFCSSKKRVKKEKR